MSARIGGTLTAAALLTIPLPTPARAQGRGAPPPDSSVPALAGIVGRTTSEMATVVERYSADLQSMQRRYDAPDSPLQRTRMRAFYEGWRRRLAEIDFDRIKQEGKVDYVLLDNAIRYQLALLDRADRQRAEQVALMPFADRLLSLQDDRREMKPVKPDEVARVLDAVAKQVDSLRRLIDTPAPRGGADVPTGRLAAPAVSKMVANRAAEEIDRIRTMLGQWYRFYDGFDPMFTWWVSNPFSKVDESLTSYSRSIRQRLVGITPASSSATVAAGGARGGGAGGGGGSGRGNAPSGGRGGLAAEANEPIIGDPIGREGLMVDLANAMIPYTPEELIAIAEREYAFSLSEMKKASREMGFGDDWKAAMEKVKNAYVPPGEQPELIRRLAREAEEFFGQHQWITIPPLAREDWRMEMLTPDRQRVSPFFLGGEMIQVAYPTNEMTEDEKLNSLRGNNPHFSRATVFHELNPGHHLQQFMNARYFPYRRVFATPFWNEGASLYWEMFLWDHDFQVTPEDRIGALFWRMHRSARIVFSLGFHLGRMTPEQAIQYLIDSVNFEPANAEGEVRRSFNGSYAPIYQAAYMLGGLQLRALHKELVDTKKMTELQFHDAIYQGGPMPIAMVRARLANIPLTRDGPAPWKFADMLPPPIPRPEKR